MCSTRACRPVVPMVLALTDTGSARTGRGVICTPAFCMACASASESVSVPPFWRGWWGPLPGFLARILAARPEGRCAADAPGRSGAVVSGHFGIDADSGLSGQGYFQRHGGAGRAGVGLL